MNKTPFFSTKVDVRLKRVGIAIFLIIPFPLMLFVVGLFCYELVDNSLRNYYSVYQVQEKTQPLVLGTANISNLDNVDEPYYKYADVFIEGKWEPNEYIQIERVVNVPEYDIKVGSVVKDSWVIGKNKYALECEPINDEEFHNPPYWPRCTLRVNDYWWVNESIRSDIICEDYDNFVNPTGCKIQVGIILYKDVTLGKSYLFISSTQIGSIHGILAYEVEGENFYPLYFDFKDSLSDDLLTRGVMSFEMVYTDFSKTNFRLISYFYDPGMRTIKGIYREWKITNGRWLSDKKIVSL